MKIDLSFAGNVENDNYAAFNVSDNAENFINKKIVNKVWCYDKKHNSIVTAFLVNVSKLVGMRNIVMLIYQTADGKKHLYKECNDIVTYTSYIEVYNVAAKHMKNIENSEKGVVDNNFRMDVDNIGYEKLEIFINGGKTLALITYGNTYYLNEDEVDKDTYIKMRLEFMKGGDPNILGRKLISMYNEYENKQNENQRKITENNRIAELEKLIQEANAEIKQLKAGL